MQKSKRHILSTRPLPASLIEEAALHHIIIDEISFIQTKPITGEAGALYISQLFQKPITAVFTSMNAVTAVAGVINQKPDWNIYSIGHSTAGLITQLFQLSITGTAADAEALADVVINDGVKEVYFFCGNMRREVLPQKLRKANILVNEIVVYETEERPAVVPAIYDAILFYSPSAVHSFFSVNKIPGGTLLFAIGKTTAEAIRQYTDQHVRTADTPGKENLVRQVIQHFNTQKREA